MNDEPKNPELRQEEDVISWRLVLRGALAAFVMAAVLVFVAWRSVAASEQKFRPSGRFPEKALTERRQVSEVHQDLLESAPGFGQLLDAKKQRELSTYGWVDREHRIARIPIDLAMDAVVEENRR